MAAKEPSRKPNIIWIMADDLSWGDLGCYGQEKIRTPNLDRLAAEGVRFTQCYSGATVCAPSRSSLMQGLHQGHATVRGNMVGFEGGTYRHGLQPGDVTVAQVLKDAGYATGIFGKWGLAVHDQYGVPNAMGFDEFFGYLNQRKAHSYYPPYLWHNRDRVDLPGNVGHDHHRPNEYDENGRIIPNGVADPSAAQYSFDLYAERGRQFVRDHAGGPFFLYLAYTLPHGVLEVPEMGEYAKAPWPLAHRIYAAMVSRLDREVGRLLDILDQLRLREDTLIFFVSDNGYSFDGAAADPSLDDVFHHRGPWKGKKGNLDQGGLRVPAIASWPGRIRPGQTCDHVWAFWDFLPTAAQAAGAEVPANIDGVSILPTLLGRPDEQEPHKPLYWEAGNQQALRLGPWWAVRRSPSKPVELYDANGDPGQQHDVAEERPDVVRQAEELFHSEHTPTPYFRSPGELTGQWSERRRQMDVQLDDNVDR